MPAMRDLEAARCATSTGPTTSEVSMAKAHRTTHRSVAGRKLYAVRDAKGRFKDIQTYQRAHRADLKRKAKAEK
jgi:hypothetical protein